MSFLPPPPLLPSYPSSVSYCRVDQSVFSRSSSPHMLTHSLSPNILFLLLHCTCIAALLLGPFFGGIGSGESHPPEQSTCRKKGKRGEEGGQTTTHHRLLLLLSCPGRRDGWCTTRGRTRLTVNRLTNYWIPVVS